MTAPEGTGRFALKRIQKGKGVRFLFRLRDQRKRNLTPFPFLNLRLPSLDENRLEGYAYSFRIVLPLFDAEGNDVYTDPILKELFKVLNDRFGGCMVASSSSAPQATSNNRKS